MSQKILNVGRATLATIGRARRVRSAFVTNAVSSLGNLALAIGISRSAPLDELGRFAVAFSVYALGTGVIRAAVTESVLTRRDWDRYALLAGRQVSALGTLVGLLTLSIGFLLGSNYLIVGGIALPGLALFDHLKTMDIAVGRANRALRRELGWSVLVITTIALASRTAMPGIWIFVIWAGTGAVIGIVGSLANGISIVPGWSGSRRETRDAGMFGLDYMAGSGVAQSTTSILASAFGTSVVGSLRGAATLIGPIGLVATTARSLLIPHLLRTLTEPRAVQRRSAMMVSSGLIVLVIPFALLVAFLPDRVGQLALGSNWQFAEPLLPAAAIELCFAVAATVPFAGHRVARAGARTLMIRIGAAPFRVGGVLVGAGIGGAQGAAIALACIAGLTCAMWWISYWILTADEGVSGE